MTTKNPKKRGETGLRTVVELVERRLQSAPSAAACKVRNVSGQWYSITWRERVASVRQFAGRLIEAGIQHGDRVAIFGPPCAEWQLAEWGAIFAGGDVVGIDPNTPVGQLRELLATV